MIASCLAAGCGGEALSAADCESSAVVTAPGSDVAATAAATAPPDLKAEDSAGSIGGKYPSLDKQKRWTCGN
jgi:hypothetical protein